MNFFRLFKQKARSKGKRAAYDIGRQGKRGGGESRIFQYQLLLYRIQKIYRAESRRYPQIAFCPAFHTGIKAASCLPCYFFYFLKNPFKPFGNMI